jgi:hypothetical protein
MKFFTETIASEFPLSGFLVIGTIRTVIVEWQVEGSIFVTKIQLN